MLTFAASPRWSKCPASAQPVPDDLPAEPDSEIVRESRAAQWSVRAFLYGDASVPEEVVGRETVTPDIAASTWAYARAVADRGAVVPRLHEMRTASGHVVAGGSDADVAVSGDGVLHVCRFSWGWRWVNPREDLRLLLPMSAVYDPVLHARVELHVYQPRVTHLDGPWRTAVLHHAEIRQTVDALCTLVEIATNERYAQVNSECRYCPLRSRCRALAEAAYEDLDRVEREGAGRRLTGRELGDELRTLRLARSRIEARLTGLEAEAEARIRSGTEIVDGFHLRPRQGRAYVEARPGAFRLMTGHDLMKDPVAKTPAELKREGVDPAVVDRLTRRGPGRLELKEINRNQVKRMFRK